MIANIALLKQLTGLVQEHKSALLREIRETRELKDLLLEGLRRPLSREERRRLRQQLLDICLAIPALSLAVGAPGGMVLLVVLYRVLPGWLVPSAFRRPPVELPQQELFCVVDEHDEVIGVAPRGECHGNPLLIHRVAHVLVFTPAGELLLQKRAPSKDIQPGKWDTSVGGHLRPGEDYRSAAYREMAEELGIPHTVELEFLYKYELRNSVESENVATYRCVFGGRVDFERREISQVRPWSLAQIERCLGSGIFTANFEQEFACYLRFVAGR